MNGSEVRMDAKADGSARRETCTQRAEGGERGRLEDGPTCEVSLLLCAGQTRTASHV